MKQSVLARARELLARRNGAIAALIVLGAFAFFFAENATPQPQVDDAYIFYRYAKNLIAGYGFVYNYGERVEGVTSLLWTLLVAGGMRLGADPVSFGHWLGVVSGGALIWLTYRYAAFELVGSERVAAAFAPWLLVLSKPFAIWATAGLETPLFAVTALGALVLLQRGRHGLAVLVSAVSVLVRPEGVVLGAVVLGFACLRRDLTRPKKLLLLAAYAGFLAALTAFRITYFGSWLPNTFYAKVGGEWSWWVRYYVLSYVVHTMLPTLWPSALAVKQRPFLSGLALYAATFVVVVAVGGDAFGNSRFFLPVLPVSCALAARGALEGLRRGTAVGRFAVLGVVVSAFWFAFGSLVGAAALVVAAALSAIRRGWRLRMLVGAAAVPLLIAVILRTRHVQPASFASDNLTRRALVVGALGVPSRRAELESLRISSQYSNLLAFSAADLLAQRRPVYKLVATVGVGALGYYSKARILDIVGLTDPVIARSKASGPDGMPFPGHQRSNSRYVLSRNPHFIMIPEKQWAYFKLPALLELWDDPEFQRRYVWDPELSGFRRVD